VSERWPPADLLHSSGVWLVRDGKRVRELAAQGQLAIEGPRAAKHGSNGVLERLVAAVESARRVLGGEVIDGIADKEQARAEAAHDHEIERRERQGREQQERYAASARRGRRRTG